MTDQWAVVQTAQPFMLHAPAWCCTALHEILKIERCLARLRCHE